MRRIGMTVMALAMVGLCALSTAGSQGRNGGNPPPATLSVPARQALLEALNGKDGEYAAYATYTAIVQKWGNVLPYAHIQQSEARHIEALQRQLRFYGVPVPPNPYLGQIHLSGTLAQIAQQEANAEQQNVAMYDRLMARVQNYPNLVNMFTNLRRVSQEHHLPALQMAAQNGGALTQEQCRILRANRGRGFGMGRGQWQSNGQCPMFGGLNGNGRGRGGMRGGRGMGYGGYGGMCPFGIGPR
jgi:hypothetical protein